MKLYRTLKDLTHIPAPSGAEEAMAAHLGDLMRPLCDTVSTDALGNLICVQECPGAEKTLLFCAHMDEIGFLVTDADEKGFLYLAPLGGVHADAAAYSRLKFENGVSGVAVPKADTKKEELDAHSFVCDIGKTSRKAALAAVPIGTCAVTDAPLTRLSSSLVSGRGLDNKLGAAVLIETARLLQNEQAKKYRIVYLFSVQEEVGVRGAGAAAFAVHPDLAVNVDATPSQDACGAHGTVKLSGGVCVKYKDRRVICDRALTRGLCEIAAKKDIPTQAEILQKGGTDTGSIQAVREGVVASALSVPVRYLHTDCETASLRDAEWAVQLLAETAKESL